MLNILSILHFMTQNLALTICEYIYVEPKYISF